MRGCPMVADGLDGELVRLLDRGTGGMPILQRRVQVVDLGGAMSVWAVAWGPVRARPCRRGPGRA
jgi:hypothetical protein